MKLKNTRTIGIVLAVVAGLLALLYLGGLLCQVRLNYVHWLAAGGITGKAEITPIKMGVLACWLNGLSPTGLKCCLLVVFLLTGGYLFFTLYSRFGSKDRDERNFSGVTGVPMALPAG